MFNFEISMNVCVTGYLFLLLNVKYSRWTREPAQAHEAALTWLLGIPVQSATGLFNSGMKFYYFWIKKAKPHK